MKQIILIAAALLTFAATTLAAASTMNLQVRKGDLRRSPSYLSAIVGTATYGDRFTVAEIRGAWSRVTAVEGGLSGWLHSSALTRKKIKLTAGETDAQVAASSGELALAGKGFNSDVEDQFKEQNRQANFTAVDLIETIRVSARQIRAFLKAGHVIPQGGTQ